MEQPPARPPSTSRAARRPWHQPVLSRLDTSDTALGCSCVIDGICGLDVSG